jgi:hypothetical protein
MRTSDSGIAWRGFKPGRFQSGRSGLSEEQRSRPCESCWRRVVLVASDTARLLRYADLEYEYRILGPLEGGKYSETFSLREGTEEHEIRFEYEPLKLKIEFRAKEPMPANEAALRTSLRVWGSRTL